MQSTLNKFHQDRFKVSFSNIPELKKETNSLSIYDNFVRSIVIPDYNLEQTFVEHKMVSRIHPIAKVNDGLSQLQIEYKCDENLQNYYSLFKWIKAVRSGQVSSKTIAENNIKSIDLQMLNNQKEVTSIIHFTDAFLLSLSSLSLAYGDSTEATFTCNFLYQEENLEIL